MARTLFVCAVLAALPSTALAQQAAPAATETVVRLTVQPMAAPKPALKYQLLPELTEMNPGNPIQAYMKCFAEQNNFFHSKAAIANLEKWQTMPLQDLPRDEMRRFGYDEGTNPLRQADYSARLDTPDWQILLPLRKEGQHLLLPDIQQLRELASHLKVRFRLEVAGRRFDDAVRTAKTMFALSRHLGEHPTPIVNLVGMAVANLTTGPLEEMIGQPGCPNLYWALSDLPNPLVEMRKGVQGERLMMAVEFDRLIKTTPMAEAELKGAGARVDKVLQYVEGAKKGAQGWIDARAGDEGHVKAARQRLVEYGLAEGVVQEMPAVQVILLDEKRSYEVWRDDGMKWRALPYWEADARSATAAKDDGGLFGKLLSNEHRVRKAQVRLEQRIGLLRHVEALRMYAAAHDGKLPGQLSDVEVPLPVDPFTGKPFHYKVEGDTATLRGSPPRGEGSNPAYNLRFEVTVAK
jgi:hypothetical protein